MQVELPVMYVFGLPRHGALCSQVAALIGNRVGFVVSESKYN